MTKKEFIEFIASFNKDAGNYTNDELYEIGVAHKSIPLIERSWVDLVKLLGVKKSSETFRKWVTSRQAREGTLPKNTNILSERTLEEIDAEDLVERKQELWKERQRLRDERSALNRSLRDDARIDSMKEAIESAAQGLKKLPKVAYKGTPRTDDVEAIALFSDLHLGVEFDNFYNSYNNLIAMARVQKYVDDIIGYCKLHNVKRLNFVNLGDAIHGIIHVSARVSSQFDVMEQVMQAGEIIGNALHKLQAAAPEVIYRSSTDNHARISPNKKDAIEKENFGRLIDWYLEERLKDTKVVFAKDNLDIDLGKFTLLNGKSVMFSHGHRDTATKVFQNFIGATEEFIHYMLLGHYHSERVSNTQGSRLYINGSIVGTEHYAHSQRYYTKPAQTLLIFDGSNVINHSIDLDVKAVV